MDIELLEHLETQALRADFSLFLERCFYALNQNQNYLANWHIDTLCHYLKAVEDGHIRRLIINIPPRYMKSLTVSVSWPAWLLGHSPHKRVIVTSYAEKLSLKHSLDCRMLIQQPWYQRCFPELIFSTGQVEKHKFVTTEQGLRLASSVGGTLTGEGGDILIADDPLNPLHAQSQTLREKTNQWFEHTFTSRLNDKKRGAIIVVMQRLHAEDVSGFLIKKGGWEVVNLPAIAEETSCYPHYFRLNGEALHPARENNADLRKLQHEMGSLTFSAQYQQRPKPKDGAMIRRNWLKYAEPPSHGDIIHSWDTAIKTGSQNDPSVCITARLHDGHLYLIDVIREKLEYHQLRQRIIELAERDSPHAILIEDKASGQSLLQDLRQETTLPLIPVLPKQDKITRFARITPLIEGGRLFIRPHTPWLTEFETEVLSFPATKHDDQVDALSQLLNWWQKTHRHTSELRRI